MRSVKDQIAARLTKTSDAKIKLTGNALIETLTAIEGEIYQYRNRSSQDPLNYPIRLNNKLAALQGLAKTDLAALNTMLAKKKIEAVKDGVPPVSEK